MRDPVFLNCAECSFWRAGDCRRRAPVPGGLLEERLINPYSGVWPTTKDGDGCADGELRARTPEELAAAADPILDFGCCRHKGSDNEICRCGCRHRKWTRVR